MNDYVIPLTDPAATRADHVGPKAANLAALAQAGLPTPAGFCLTADAYRRQIAHLGLSETVGDYAQADALTQRRLSVEFVFSFIKAISLLICRRRFLPHGGRHKSLRLCVRRH